jgi:hypothetical protein
MGKSVKKCDDSRTENNVITPASEGGTLFGGCNNDGDDDYNDEAVGNANAEPNRYTIETSKADSATTRYPDFSFHCKNVLNLEHRH